jgi:hypothetical protein
MRTRLLLLLLALTLPAWPQSTPRRLFLPGLGHVRHDRRNTRPADVMICGVAPAEYTITATKIAGHIAAAAPDETCGFALYPNGDASMGLAYAFGSCAGGPLTQSGLSPFTITAGLLYRMCVCGQNTNGAIYSGIAQAAACCQDFNLTQLIQTFHPEYFGTATNGCTAGVPPTSTGAIIPDTTTPGRNAPEFPVIMVEE